MRTSVVLVAALLVFGAALGCNGPSATTDGGGGDAPAADLIETICMRRIDSPTGCDAACSAAGSAASMGACASQANAVNGHAEFTMFGACAGACSSARTCPMGAELTDCACGAGCVRERSAVFQSLFEAMVTCFDAEIAAACY